MRFQGPDLDHLPSAERRRDLADTAVTHAVFGGMGGLIGFLDEDMLWLSHPEPRWTAEVSRTFLARADEAVDAICACGHDLADVADLLPDGLTMTHQVLDVLKEYRLGPDGRPQRLAEFSDYFDAMLPVDRPVLLHEVGWALKCSLERVLRGLVEIIAACHRLVVGPEGHPPDSYAEAHPTMTPSYPFGRHRSAGRAE